MVLVLRGCGLVPWVGDGGSEKLHEGVGAIVTETYSDDSLLLRLLSCGSMRYSVGSMRCSVGKDVLTLKGNGRSYSVCHYHLDI